MPSLCSDVINQYTCCVYIARYVGSTVRNFQTRICEHRGPY